MHATHYRNINVLPQDHNDIKMPCHLLLTKLTTVAPAAVLRALDTLVQPLQQTLTTRPKSDAVKQEVRTHLYVCVYACHCRTTQLDRHEDMLKSCLRTIDAISRMDNVGGCVPFQTMMDKVVLAGAMKDKFKSVQKERAEGQGDTWAEENNAMDIN